VTKIAHPTVHCSSRAGHPARELPERPFFYSYPRAKPYRVDPAKKLGYRHDHSWGLRAARAHHDWRLADGAYWAGVASVLFRWKVSNPTLIAATAVVGLIAFPILQPTWVIVK
jgi:hypothetical protein